MPFTPLGLDHLVLYVRDQDRQKQFYMDILGCTVERINPEISLIQLRFGEHLIDLVPGEGQNAPENKASLDHFCLSIKCDDLEGLVDELKNKGVTMQSDTPIARTGAYGRSPAIYLTDPEGYTVELKPR